MKLVGRDKEVNCSSPPRGLRSLSELPSKYRIAKYLAPSNPDKLEMPLY